MREGRRSVSDVEEVRRLITDADQHVSSDPTAASKSLSEAAKLAAHHVENVSRDKSQWQVIQVEINVRIAELAEREARIDDALKLISETYNTPGLNTNHDLELRVGVDYARLLMTRGIYDRSIELFYKMRELALSLENNTSLGVIYGNIATILFNTWHYNEAFEWFNKASDLFESIHEYAKQAQSIRGIGMAYSKQGLYSEALDTYERAKNVLDTAGLQTVREMISIEESMGVDQLNLADKTGHQKHFKESLAHFEKSLALSRELDEKIHQAVALRNIAQVLVEDDFKGQDLKRALALFNDALNIAKHSGVNLLESQILRELSKLQERLGLHKAALDTFREFYERERDVVSEQTESKIRSFEIRAAVEHSERNAQEQLERSIQLEAELERQKRQVTSISLAIGHKNAALRDARIELRDVATQAAPSIASKLRRVITQIELAEQNENYWEELEGQLSAVYGRALQTLAAKHPELTPTERRVCALIIHDLSSKEIARLLSAEVRSIEKYRQRIRKKLKIRESENLNSYLTSLA